MKLQQKIILVSFLAALVTGFLFAAADSNHFGKAYFGYFGLVGFFGGLLQVIAGLFLLFLNDKRYAQGFLMSGGILMLVGFVTCTGTFNI